MSESNPLTDEEKDKVFDEAFEAHSRAFKKVMEDIYKNHGVPDREEADNVDEETQRRAGEVTKIVVLAFAATVGVGTAVGQISLSDAVAALIEQYEDAYRGMALNELLQHTVEPQEQVH